MSSSINSNAMLPIKQEIVDEDTEKLVEWINSAQLATETSEKLDNWRKVQEFILHKQPHCLLSYLNVILENVTSTDGEVKKWLVGFLEEACKTHEKVFEVMMPSLQLLLNDDSVQVQKRVIQACISVYKNMLSWLAKATQITESMESAWNRFHAIKMSILNMIDNDNDGIRTKAIRFLEYVILIQTYPDSNVPQAPYAKFSLEDIPLTLKFARRRKLEQEATQIFQLMLKFQNSQYISVSNLMVTVPATCNIARARPEFLSRVVSSFTDLLAHPPPTLTETQVESIKKTIKSQFLLLIRHPCSLEVQPILVTKLTELGVSSQEIQRLIPKDLEKYRKKIKRTVDEPASSGDAKRTRNEDKSENVKTNNEKFIFEHLTPQNATEIVLAHISRIPGVAPKHFLQSYRPAASVSVCVKNIAKLLAAQCVEANVNLSEEVAQFSKIEEDIVRGSEVQVKQEKMDVDEKEKKTDAKVEHVKSNKAKAAKKDVKLKGVNMEKMARPYDYQTRQELMCKALDRILCSSADVQNKTLQTRVSRILVTLASSYTPLTRDTVLNYILIDIKSRIDLAIAWLYEEYSQMQGFAAHTTKSNEFYNELLCNVVTKIENDVQLRLDTTHDLLRRVYLHAPLITDDAINVLKRVCATGENARVNIELVYELIEKRPPRACALLNVLLFYTASENAIVRDEAIGRCVRAFNEHTELQATILEYAIGLMNFLTEPQPPSSLFDVGLARSFVTPAWDEYTIRACLYLTVALLPTRASLLRDLAAVYAKANAEIKRVILRMLDEPIKEMSPANSTDIFALFETYPNGAETFIIRLIHVLNESGVIARDVLVEHVRDLYERRIPDVRVLIPVLNGLTKKEVLAALPKLIKLNPVVVKEVFARLLHSQDTPVLATDLLIALHQIDDLKPAMHAAQICLAERQIYTQNVLAVALQQLIEISPLPTLLMRTVIQSIGLYPPLIGFVMGLLQRLIVKQVWQQKIVWEGFVKCCQRAKPHSFPVILALPSAQVQEVLQTCPELRAPLIEHVAGLSDAQKTFAPGVAELLMDSFDPNVAIKEEKNMDDGGVTNGLKEPLPPGMD